MHYIIDGYNLLFRMLHAGDNLKEQRQDLIGDISKKVECLQMDATIVFDAHFQEGDLTRSHVSRLEVLFTAAGETADEYIIDSLKLEKKPRQETVVTSDKKLAWQARRLLAKTETVEEFLEWLNKRYKNKLRQKKNKPVLLLTAQKPISQQSLPCIETPPVPIEAQAPKKLTTPEECFAYYLDEFVVRYEQLDAEESPKKKAKKEEKAQKEPAKKAVKSNKEKQWFQSDMDRWLEAFEEEGKNDV
jgi:hypothetical protein